MVGEKEDQKETERRKSWRRREIDKEREKRKKTIDKLKNQGFRHNYVPWVTLLEGFKIIH